MRRWGWFFGCVLMLPQMQPANGQTPSADEIVTQVMKHDADRRTALAEYASERTYEMEYKGPIGERHARMRVRMEFFAPDRKRFTVVSETGSTIFCHQVLRKLMEGEQDGALEANRLRSMLSPGNDYLKLLGEEKLDGLNTWVLDVSPKQENQFNYKGKVWVNQADFAVVRIVGSPAKNPTWLLGSSKFDYRYAQSGAFWLPSRNETVSRLRIGGEIRLMVDYGEYRIVETARPREVISASNRVAPGVSGLATSLPQ